MRLALWRLWWAVVLVVLPAVLLASAVAAWLDYGLLLGLVATIGALVLWPFVMLLTVAAQAGFRFRESVAHEEAAIRRAREMLGRR